MAKTIGWKTGDIYKDIFICLIENLNFSLASLGMISYEQ